MNGDTTGFGDVPVDFEGSDEYTGDEGEASIVAHDLPLYKMIETAKERRSRNEL